MSDWLRELQSLRAENARAVLLTIAGTRGSTPREAGAKMVVSATETIGTIGGGQLEYLCVQEACRWLEKTAADSSTDRTLLRKFTLGANCGQCCGGIAEVLFEEISPARVGTKFDWVAQLSELRDDGVAVAMITARQSRTSNAKFLVTADDCFSSGDCFDPDPDVIEMARRTLRSGTDVCRTAAKLASNVELPVLIEAVRRQAIRIVIFGAGHVGSACAAVLSTLEVTIDLVDSRETFLTACFPDNVFARHLDAPASFVATAMPNSYFLIMTHDHSIDLEICAQVLRRRDIGFCGLIGSRSKRRRFEKRLRSLGLTQTEIARLTCPIGVDEIGSKKPAAIAISVAAQLQSLLESGVRISNVDLGDRIGAKQ